LDLEEEQRRGKHYITLYVLFCLLCAACEITKWLRLRFYV